MPFRRLAWLVPAAYGVHVAEEAPGFTDWVKSNISARYTQRDFVRNNTLGLLGTAAATAAVGHIDSRTVDLAYYSLAVTQQAVFNAVFHSATTVAFHDYSPGLITSILMVPLWATLTRAAIAERRLTTGEMLASTVVAGLVHGGVVARQVFLVGVPENR